MNNQKYAAIDQGTSGTRVVVFDDKGQSYASEALAHEQITPQNGWVEHDAEMIMQNIQYCLDQTCHDVDAIGLSHQGESVVAWNSETGKPIYNAIIWQDMRTEATIQTLKNRKLEAFVKARSGLPLDPYFSASKISWIINNIPEAGQLFQQGKLRIGTMDSFFLDRLCGVFVTDYNSASRTSLFNIHTLKWDPELCMIFGVPINCLPEIRDNVGIIGYTNINQKNIPVTASIVDQFAGIYGHGCRNAGDTKATFGTGAFLQCLTGDKIYQDDTSGLLPTLCWKFPGEAPVFGLDGGVYNAASAINWAKGIGLFQHYDELNTFKSPSAISRGLTFVPALSGLGCPYWDRSAAGLWAGLSLEVTREDLLQSILEGIALRSTEIIQAMEKNSPLTDTLSIDGGLASNPYFKQFLANLTNKTIITTHNKELTAFGTAMLAKKGLGIESEFNVENLKEFTYPKHTGNYENFYRLETLQQYQQIISRARDLR